MKHLTQAEFDLLTADADRWRKFRRALATDSDVFFETLISRTPQDVDALTECEVDLIFDSTFAKLG